MSNPNNLIRPPVLNNAQANIEGANINRPVASAELTTLISNVVAQLFNTQGRQIIESIVSESREQQLVDEEISPQHRENISDLDKVPDVVRSIRDFSGKQIEFSSWRKSVERVLKIYEAHRGTPKYFGILNTIRNKVVGDADNVLESYNTPLNWEAISKCLTTHYADKRDLVTLEYEMSSLVQVRNSIPQFYQQVYSHLSLILNNIACMNMSTETARVLTDTYRNKALDTFIRGLSGDLSRLLGANQPADLPQALQLCLKLQNQSYRDNFTNNNFNYNQRQQPRIPERNHTDTHRNNTQPRQFYPELAYVPQSQTRYPQQYPYQNQQLTYNQWPLQQNTMQQAHAWQQNYPPSRPLAPKPQPRPIPMEVDGSIRTNAINYANRPTFKQPDNRPTFRQPDNRPTFRQPDKRPPLGSTFHKPPNKMQRNFHINTVQEQEQYTESEEQDTDDNQNDNNYESYDVSDIHFLE